jgi:regulator of nucleoside diphosphate kinase
MTVHPTATKPPLIIDADLYPRLLALAERARTVAPDLAARLIDEIERADLRAPAAMPADVVTIGSRVTFRDGDREQTVSIVMPHEADVEHGRVSVVSPVGAALLGLSTGQRIAWEIGYGKTATIEVVVVAQAAQATA